MTYSNNVNKTLNNILMLDSDLLIKMCIKNIGGTCVCIIGIVVFILYSRYFGSLFSVYEHKEVFLFEIITCLSPKRSVFSPTSP